MSWINKHLSPDEIRTIETAVQVAEFETEGEIVPVIVKRSSTVGHVPLTLTLIITLMLVILEIPYSEWLWVRPWVWVWPLVIVVIYYISFLIAKIPFIQKILVSERDEVDQVHQRAQLEFFLNKINRTKGGTGILIFVSVMEKKAVILADEGIASKLPQEAWNEVLGELRKHMGSGDWVSGFKNAIERSGAILREHFPATGSNDNELKNQLIIRD
jgi:putative membrane protein